MLTEVEVDLVVGVTLGLLRRMRLASSLLAFFSSSSDTVDTTFCCLFLFFSYSSEALDKGKQTKRLIDLSGIS